MMPNIDPGGEASSSSSSRVPSASSSADHHQPAAQPSRYESQKRRDWNTFGQYLRNQRPPVELPACNHSHVMDFLRYLDQFGKTKAWGSLDALIGRLRAAYEENGGSPETNPFANGAIRVYLREVRDTQAMARGIPYKKKKKKKRKSMDSSFHQSSSGI
ncbi:hypothetical protein DH2020_033595 [Rehmannia glutinosa]|uniref:ALOG domain-containing protein n=1 Tax=Rehmannia glutinosa TaxID=99300 RepID=A0ABR0VC81_REHGL